MKIKTKHCVHLIQGTVIRLLMSMVLDSGIFYLAHLEDKIEEENMKNLGKMREIKGEEEINEEMFLSCPSKVESLVTPLYFDNKSGKSFQSERSSDLPLSIFFQSANGVHITNMKVTRRSFTL